MSAPAGDSPQWATWSRQLDEGHCDVASWPKGRRLQVLCWRENEAADARGRALTIDDFGGRVSAWLNGKSEGA